MTRSSPSKTEREALKFPCPECGAKRIWWCTPLNRRVLTAKFSRLHARRIALVPVDKTSYPIQHQSRKVTSDVPRHSSS